MQLIKLRVSPEVVENPQSRTAFTITSDQRRQPRPLGPAIIRQPTAAQPTLHDDEAGAVLHALGLADAELRRDQSLIFPREVRQHFGAQFGVAFQA
jgi:hypothetical protein